MYVSLVYYVLESGPTSLLRNEGLVCDPALLPLFSFIRQIFF